MAPQQSAPLVRQRSLTGAAGLSTNGGSAPRLSSLGGGVHALETDLETGALLSEGGQVAAEGSGPVARLRALWHRRVSETTALSSDELRAQLEDCAWGEVTLVHVLPSTSDRVLGLLSLFRLGAAGNA
jgi:hypothetical protein